MISSIPLDAIAEAETGDVHEQDSPVSVMSGSDQQTARQRRIEARSRSRKKRRSSSVDLGYNDSDDDAYEDDAEEDHECDSMGPPPTKKRTQSLASIRGIKKQARYVPEIPMTKDELQKWRVRLYAFVG